MFSLEQTGQFKKDIKLAKKRGLNLALLNDVVTALVEKGELEPRYKAHKLIGNYKGFWECHIYLKHNQHYINPKDFVSLIRFLSVIALSPDASGSVANSLL